MPAATTVVTTSPRVGGTEFVRAALRGMDGHLAVIDPDHGFRSTLNEGDIIQAVTALQVHHLR